MGSEEEIRWQIIKAMLDEFPTLKEMVESYLKKKHKTQPFGTPSKEGSIKYSRGGEAA